MKRNNAFKTLLLAWFQEHGRHDLPWQLPRSPYYVWLSEIMLQQTQVATVIPYFLRFIEKFPTLKTLANAHVDEVLHLWAGLGYYARARNLHQCAIKVQQLYQGEFPSTFDQIVELPGIGPSTAAAILSMSFKLPFAILDGNVKRVLSRVHTIGYKDIHRTQPLPEKVVTDTLWSIAKSLIPTEPGIDCCHYTQAIMDLGATLCTRSKPKCVICPVQTLCQAFQNNCIESYPTKKVKKEKPVKSLYFWVIQYQDTVLLQKRPDKGIWGGLWSFLESSPDKELALLPPPKSQRWEQERHTFTHYHLDYTPIIVKINNGSTKKQLETMLEKKAVKWFNGQEIESLGLPSPIQKIVAKLKTQTIV